MNFIGGFFTGVFLTLGLILLLLFVAKTLGFTMMLRNEWRNDHGYYSYTGRYNGSYGCRKCWYHDFYDRHRYDTEKLNTLKPSDEESEEISEEELDDILHGSEAENEEEPIE